MKKTSILCVATVLAACASMTTKVQYHYTEPVPTLRLALLPHDPLSIGKPVEIDAKLNDIKTLSLIKDENLDTVHTQKIHLLIIDPTLTDYQHIHPEPTSVPGVYHFRFTPKLPGGYRVWADVTQTATHKQEYVMANLGKPKPGKINTAESSEATMGGYHFSLTFDKAPTEGGESVGVVHVTDSKGNKVESLQPLMDAYSHIVGFYDDFHTIVHIHPMGDEPKDNKTLGGSDLTFHLMPVKSGFIKLFAQVKINDKELFVPFGVNIKPAGSAP